VDGKKDGAGKFPTSGHLCSTDDLCLPVYLKPMQVFNVTGSEVLGSQG
jgi:hypothetical protein